MHSSTKTKFSRAPTERKRFASYSRRKTRSLWRCSSNLPSGGSLQRHATVNTWPSYTEGLRRVVVSMTRCAFLLSPWMRFTSTHTYPRDSFHSSYSPRLRLERIDVVQPCLDVRVLSMLPFEWSASPDTKLKQCCRVQRTPRAHDTMRAHPRFQFDTIRET